MVGGNRRAAPFDAFSLQMGRRGAPYLNCSDSGDEFLVLNHIQQFNVQRSVSVCQSVSPSVPIMKNEKDPVSSFAPPGPCAGCPVARTGMFF
jgi:hypothetical protein